MSRASIVLQAFAAIPLMVLQAHGGRIEMELRPNLAGRARLIFPRDRLRESAYEG